MGAIVAAPIQALGSCLGSCEGTFLAAVCCQLAGAGQLASFQGARAALVGLQAFSASLAVAAAATPAFWLPWFCDKLQVMGQGGLGICECAGSEACWADQLVYRVEAAGVMVFLFLLLMAASGCVQGAVFKNTVGKFMAMLFIPLALLAVPNTVLRAYGEVATASSAAFLVMQAVPLIDFGYSWSETWFRKAEDARRAAERRGDFQSFPWWKAGILAAAAALFIGSIAASVYMFIASPEVGARSVTTAAWGVAAALTVVGITCVDDGPLLTSCVVMAYAAWLTWEALATLPSGGGPRLPPWAAVTTCLASLLWFSRGTTRAALPAGQEPLIIAALPGPAPPPGSADAATFGVQGSKEFVVQCAMHAAAGIYITAALAPRASALAYGLRVAAVFLSLALYCWVLVAPHVFPNRTFGG
ncbi:unnamed protein product [Prorocentrum cordatum]|uniref:Solute carrier family 40 protein n=1 Tax=Prorocentrum cordatum TaxID=2364126 RepID=A0ABN9UPS5_9DINO|nr:unnamed protein product [Polarella glacialis]